jgi:G:T-mismatch repair DNA endonuclease (very short patch repair protein)
MAGKHCPKCTHRVSKGETKWLDLLGVPPEFRQKTLHMSSGTYYTVDAYDPTTNTVYEFHGDYWHGNPERFDPLELNERAGCTFGELYNRTVAKETTLKNDGYNVVVMWEKDFRES